MSLHDGEGSDIIPCVFDSQTAEGVGISILLDGSDSQVGMNKGHHGIMSCMFGWQKGMLGVERGIIFDGFSLQVVMGEESGIIVLHMFDSQTGAHKSEWALVLYWMVLALNRH